MKIGDKVVCIEGGRWLPTNGKAVYGEHSFGPETDEVLIIRGFQYEDEWPSYESICFRLLQPSFGEKVAEYIVEECEKIKIPETV